MKPNKAFKQLMLAGMLLILSACGAKTKSIVTMAPSSTAILSSTAAPTRIATATKPATQTPAVSPTPSGPFPVGAYLALNPFYSSGIKFLKNGSFTIPDVGSKGTYVVTGDKIVFNETAGECTGFPGTYLWAFDGKTLTLKTVEDKCPHPRRQDLSRTWTRQP